MEERPKSGSDKEEGEPTLESVLHGQARQFVELVDSLSLENLTTRYRFVDNEEYLGLLTRDVSEGMRVYWTELLGRAHIAAVTAILRSGHWMSAVLSAYSEGNALGFAAAFRALMESAADTSNGLRSTPPTLAHLYPEVSKALLGRATDIVIATELEDHLIHYSHARYLRRSERDSMPPTHDALLASKLEDLKELGNADKVAAAYRFLSDLTHPAAASVSIWLAPVDATGIEFTVSSKQGEAVMTAFLKEYKTLFFDVLMLAFNTPVVVLNTLNYFPVKELHSPALLNANFSGLAAWRRSLSEIEAAARGESWTERNSSGS